MATLDLPIDPRTAVWRLIRDRLRNDPALGAVLNTLLAWEGTNRDSNKIEDLEAPALRLTPVIDPRRWLDNETLHGTLTVELELYLAQTDVEDMLNMQGAIEEALGSSDFAEELRGAGALGPIEFSDPFGSESIRELKALIGARGLSLRGAFRVDVAREVESGGGP